MTGHKSYGQFCALARALDHLGDRWTLLVVRELLVHGPRTFRSLQAALAGVSPNLLVDRLRTLAADGLVQRNDAVARSKDVTYDLTAAGRGLEPVVLELIRWGTRYMHTGPLDDRVDPAWTALALKALLEGPSPSPEPAVVTLAVADARITVRADGQRREVHPGPDEAATVRVRVDMPHLLAVASGAAPVTSLLPHAEGAPADVSAAVTAALAPSPSPSPAPAPSRAPAPSPVAAPTPAERSP